MAQRRIAIVIEVKGANRAKNKIKGVGQATGRLTHLQGGLTASFLKGNLAARGISMAINGLLQAMKFATSSSIDFEFAIKKLSAIKMLDVGATNQLEKAIRNVAAISPKTAVEVANTALSISKLGLSADEVSKSLKGIIDLSVVLDEDVNMIGKTMVAVKNVFGKSASEMNEIGNTLFTGFANSALDLEKFSTAFNFAGASAEGAGVTFENLTALMGVLSSAGVRASTMGTQLRSIFLDLSDPTSKASKAIGGMTIQVDGLIPVLEALSSAELENFEIKDKFTKRSVNVVEILSKNVEVFKKLNEETIRNTTNLDKASKSIEETAKIAKDKAISAFQDLAIAMGKAANPIVQKFWESLADTINSINPDRGDPQFFKNTDKLREAVGLLKELDNVLNAGTADAALGGRRLQGQLTAIGGSALEFTGGPGFKAEVDAVLGKYMSMLQDVEDQVKPLNDALQKFKQITGEIGGTKSLKGLQELSNQIKSFMGDLTGENQQRAVELLEKIRVKMKDINDLVKKGNKLKSDEAQKKHAKLMAKLNGELEKLQRNYDGTLGKLTKNELKIIKTEEKVRSLWEAFKKLGEEIQKAMSGRNAQAFDQILSGVNNVIGAFGELSRVQADGEVKRAEAAGASEEEIMAIRKKSFETQKRYATAIATMNTAQAVTKALASSVPPLSFVLAGLALTAGGVQIAAIQAQQFASGFDGIVRQPTLMQVGEAGPERVQVTSSAKTARSGGGDQPIQIIVQGSIIDKEGFISAVNQANQGIGRRFINV